MKNFIKKLPIILLIFIFVSSCGGFNMPSARKQPTNADERIKKTADHKYKLIRQMLMLFK